MDNKKLFYPYLSRYRDYFCVLFFEINGCAVEVLSGEVWQILACASLMLVNSIIISCHIDSDNKFLEICVKL